MAAENFQELVMAKIFGKTGRRKLFKKNHKKGLTG